MPTYAFTLIRTGSPYRNESLKEVGWWETTRWAEMLKKIPPLYIRAVKYGHYRNVKMKMLENERDYINFVWPQEKSEDRKEGLQAFLEKRQPHFKGQ